MSALDVQALEANFTSWRNERVPHLSLAKAFERYAVEQALKDADLSDDEVESGLFGGPDDGGIDGMYFFIKQSAHAAGVGCPGSGYHRKSDHLTSQI